MCGCDCAHNANKNFASETLKNHGLVHAGGSRLEVVQSKAAGGVIMVPLSIHDVKGGFFLIASFVLLALICAIAALGTVMRPQRWCERQTRLTA